MLIISLSVSKKRQQTGLPFTTQSIQQCHRRVRPDHLIGATPSSSLVSGLKTSFSRLDPIPRGQATVIRSFIRRGRSHEQQTIQSDKLPSTLQSFPYLRPARPSIGSAELGSDVSGQNPKHLEASRSIFSSQCMQNRHQAQSRCKLLFLLRRHLCRRAPNRCSAPRRSFGGPSGAQRSKSATASGQTMVELSGIEPLTPCLQSRCSPS